MKSKTSAAFLLVATFLLGGITGAVSHNIYQNHVAAANTRPSISPHDIVGEIARGLNLDAAQKETLKGIISQSRERYRALSVQFRPQYETIRAETREQIRQILRDDQKARFEECFREIDKRHMERRPQPR